ncbi:hypothetical protein OYC64_011990 [Pagothenia borchgrevinki]|uniref:Alkylated DNA repair protein AlkB homologue 8 N-terminal domain-containing protein n=1 Tax=Pagothenia borchgrevinki TaxID=8213 RepID=A0ABD2G880_PAGBO
MSRLYFLRKLRSFNVKMLEIFYQSVVASALFFAAVCWEGSIRAGDTSRINKLIRKAGSVTVAFSPGGQGKPGFPCFFGL